MTMHDTPPAEPGEIYVEIDGTGRAFPALIDATRWNGWAKPSFRKPVVDALADWLTTLHDATPDDWTYTAEFSGDTLIIVDTELDNVDLISPDTGRRWAVGSAVWRWVISTPQLDIEAERALLRDVGRLTPDVDEALVTINHDGRDPAFPALISDGQGQAPTGAPRFRRPVAEVVVAWLNDVAQRHPWRTDRLYWDGDTVALVEYERVGSYGYLPTRFAPDTDGRYCIDDFLWEHRPHSGTAHQWSSKRAH